MLVEQLVFPRALPRHKSMKCCTGTRRHQLALGQPPQDVQDGPAGERADGGLNLPPFAASLADDPMY